MNTRVKRIEQIMAKIQTKPKGIVIVHVHMPTPGHDDEKVEDLDVVP